MSDAATTLRSFPVDSRFAHMAKRDADELELRIAEIRRATQTEAVQQAGM